MHRRSFFVDLKYPTLALLSIVSTFSSINEALADTQMPTVSLTDFHRRAERGERLDVVFLGGSLTWGANASDPQRTSWRGLMMDYLTERYSRSSFRFTDAAIGGTGSNLALFRIDRDVLPRRPDLVFLDFTVNDNAKGRDVETLAAYERILRDLLTARSAVLPVLLCFRDHVTDADAPIPSRHESHLRLAGAYRLPAADVLAALRTSIARNIDSPSILWGYAHDNSHPDDPGYAAMFHAIRTAYEAAITSDTTPTVPADTVFPDLYSFRQRQILTSMPKLPVGWIRDKTRRTAMWFDGLSSRWMDDVAVARKEGDSLPWPLEMTFRGSMVGILGERDPLSVPFRVWIDGKLVTARPSGDEPWRIDTTRMGKPASGAGSLVSWTLLARDLPDGTHTLKIEPDFSNAPAGSELRIESICSAGHE